MEIIYYITLMRNNTETATTLTSNNRWRFVSNTVHILLVIICDAV